MPSALPFSWPRLLAHPPAPAPAAFPLWPAGGSCERWSGGGGSGGAVVGIGSLQGPTLLLVSHILLLLIRALHALPP